MFFRTYTRGERLIAAFTFSYIAAFAVYYLSIQNYEFIWYVAILIFFFGLILLTLPRTRFDPLILTGLSLWGLAHMAGGSLRVGGRALYQLSVWHLIGEGDSLVFKFDQLVHFFGFGVASLVFFHLLRPYLRPTVNWKVVYLLIVLGGSGFGALNEVVEFIAVVLFKQTGVGGYYNTALDLVFNLLGAVAAILLIHYHYRPRLRSD